MKRQVLLCAVFLISLAAVPRVFADGGFMIRVDRMTDLREPEQKGIILFKDGRQDLILEVSYQGAPEDFVWLVPVPSRPDVSVDVPELFTDVSRTARYWQSPSALDPWRRGSLRDLALPAPPVEPRAQIWNLDVLPPERGKLRKWIADHDLRLSAAAERVVQRYVLEGWYFVGMSIDASSRDEATDLALRKGTIQPVRLQFDTPEPVFPLRISAINPGFSDIALYVFSDKPLVNRTAAHATWDRLCLGSVPVPRRLAAAGAPGEDAPNLVLTRLTASFNAREMREDVYFKPYDPRRDLRHKDLRHRLGAIAWIGTSRDAQRTEDLLDLANESLDDEVLGATAWALGRIGDERAAPVLERLARSRPQVRYEVMRSLLAIDPSKAATLLLVDLRMPGRGSDVWGDFDRVPFLVDALMDVPGSFGIETLKRIQTEQGGMEQWASLKTTDSGVSGGVTPGVAATAILAARGDPEAWDTIVRALASGGTAYAEALAPKPPPKVSIAGGRMIHVSTIEVVSFSYPMRHPGNSGRIESAGRSIRDAEWPALAVFERLFEHQDAARNAIVRQAASITGLPEVPRTFLLGLLPADEEVDFARLE